MRSATLLLAVLCAAVPAPPRALVAQPRTVPVATPTAADIDLPVVDREFRGVWVATVGNMDWPSSRNLSVAEQQTELLQLLDRAQRLNLNAVIFQVRPAGDALYESKLEPWSHFLTGRQGRAPVPFWDPLAFAITEAHRRGLELHAWFNPFRAGFANATSPLAATHLARRHPELLRRYGSYLWFDPGEARTQDWALQVVLDVVRRYDVDGVHIDDYFYPYRENDRRGRTLPFPDDDSYARYRRTGGRLGRDDWRRQNVDRFVERLYGAVKQEKPHVLVGVSPFGIWRPGYPEQIRGLDAYQEIFADARKWVHNGWMDYVTPQLYWTMAQHAQSYPVLLRWWVDQNREGRHVWPGNYTSRVTEGRMRAWTPEEVAAQVRATRAQSGATGNVHFSMNAFSDARSPLFTTLSQQVYDAPALVPASPWLGRSAAPLKARVTVNPARAGDGQLSLTLGADDLDRVNRWVVRARCGEQWTVRLVPGVQRSYVVGCADGTGRIPSLVTLSAVDRVGVEGPADVLARTTPAASAGSQ